VTYLIYIVSVRVSWTLKKSVERDTFLQDTTNRGLIGVSIAKAEDKFVLFQLAF